MKRHHGRMVTVAGMDESLHCTTVQIVLETHHGFQRGPLLSSLKAFWPALVKSIEESPNIVSRFLRAMKRFFGLYRLAWLRLSFMEVLSY
jgi:hypothetical protein